MVLKKKWENFKFLEEEKATLCAELETLEPTEESYGTVLKRIDEIDRIIREREKNRVDICDKAVRHGLTIAGLYVTVKLFEAGLEFETEGTPRSIFFKEARNSLLKKIF